MSHGLAAILDFFFFFKVLTVYIMHVREPVSTVCLFLDTALIIHLYSECLQKGYDLEAIYSFLARKHFISSS